LSHCCGFGGEAGRALFTNLGKLSFFFPEKLLNQDVLKKKRLDALKIDGSLGMQEKVHNVYQYAMRKLSEVLVAKLTTLTVRIMYYCGQKKYDNHLFPFLKPLLKNF